MFIFDNVTVDGAKAGFFHHLEQAEAGGTYASSRLKEALVNLLALQLAIARNGDGGDALTEFRRNSAVALDRVRDDLHDFVEELADETEQLGDGSEADWYDMCVRRSAIQVLREEYASVDAVSSLDESNLERIDRELQRIGLEKEPLSRATIPVGLPAGHWWWTYPPGSSVQA